jgi:anti-sigma B factor antagonist
MEIIEIQRGAVLIMEPRGRIDTNGAKPFGDRVVELIRSGSHNMLIDMQHILYISSAGFRALLIARKLADEVQGRLVLCGMSAEIRRLFDIAGFTGLFTVCAGRDEGLAKAAQQ